MRILILAGTSEARDLSQILATRSDLQVTASLAGATRAPRDLGVETRVGGFGGVDGLVQYLRDAKIDMLIDATHPFAATMTNTAAAVCADLGLRHVILQRDEWIAGAGDDWHMIDAPSDTPALIAQGKTVFLATGRQTLAQYECLSGRKLLARVIDPPKKPFPFDGGAFVQGRPPFSIDDEIALFQLLGVDWLVVKNSGGAASRSKLDAARALNMPVAMLRRPKLPVATRVSTVDECMTWIDT
ncbi:precorrin-6x reductase [Amylibacter kogurei]|uniref:Precorrin-6x reductase n=1 Tax=Paramylibacter kogurei TaxID=1889778 RepID=A0A2G5K7Z1_9RHOB|nr:cobalt-precorrin-6A reductase [Amylibacter kogurei]PIB24990.1 precorrin-6x reductase [Amylibacter kogurei]